MGLVGKVLLAVVRTLVTAWDWATNWAYSLFTHPANTVTNYGKVRAYPDKEWSHVPSVKQKNLLKSQCNVSFI